MRIELDGRGLNVREDGNAHGPPVLFLHGISSCAETYDFVVPELPDHRVVRLDFRGHGESDRAPDRYLVDDYAADALAAIEQVVGQPTVVVGHSLGGITAAQLAKRRPDLVRAVFLEDPPLYFGEPGVFEATQFAVVFPLIKAAIEQWQEAGTPAEEIAAQLGDTPSMSGRGTMGEENLPDALAAFGRGFARLDTTVYDPVFDGRSLGQYDVTTPIPVPSTVLLPDRELGAALYAEQADHLTSVSPAVEVVRVDGVGHLVHDSRTHRGRYLDELRRFLAEHAPTA